MDVTAIAQVCHEANRALQTVINDPVTSPPWEQTPDWQRACVINGVRKAQQGASPEELHASWCSSMCAEGWVYGPVKDPDHKTHPCLVAFDELSPEQQAKDSLLHAVVNALTEQKET
ncbi:RyR domain-containing protein [Nocardiopsis synnemataformans]|uniref:RyR domain-containing protein n=1 Tax=Nocardiopsis synnemataformans TaxID=61305 RepID=UPI003EBF94BD